MLKQNIYKALRTIRAKGVRSMLIKAFRYMQKKKEFQQYHFPDESELDKQRKTVFARQPKISILVPLYRTPLSFLQEMIASVESQTYANWELCLADGTAETSEISDYISTIKDERIKYALLPQNGGISENTNAALRMASGDYIALLDHDDLLVESALFEVVSLINKNNDADVIYTDEDKFDSATKELFMPHFKPDYNEIYFLTNNYICHFFTVKKEIADIVGGFSSKYDGAQDFDFILRCVEQAENVYHIPEVLYHWRCHNNSTSLNPENKTYAYENGRYVIQDHYERLGIPAKVEMIPGILGYYKTCFSEPEKNEVAILQIGKGKAAEKLDKDLYECFVTETADVSAINALMEKIDAAYVLLVDGRIQPLENKDVSELYGCLSQHKVGAAGAKIIRKNTIQYAGSILGIADSVVYAYAGKSVFEDGYFNRAVVPQETAIASGCCVLLRMDAFKRVQGFDEAYSVNAAVADFCLKISRNLQFKTVFCPYVTIKSQGKVKLFADKNEEQLFVKKWSSVIQQGDKYYNKNLSMTKNDFSIL